MGVGGGRGGGAGGEEAKKHVVDDDDARFFEGVFSKRGSFFHVKFRVFCFCFSLQVLGFLKRRKKKRNTKKARAHNNKKRTCKTTTRKPHATVERSPLARIFAKKRETRSFREEANSFFFFRNARAPTGQALVASVVLSSSLCPLLFWRIF